MDTVMHEVSLLRGLLESAGGDMNAIQHKFDTKWSANDSLARLGHLLGLGLTEPVSFGDFDALKLRVALSHCQIFECDELDLERLQRQTCLYVPIGFMDKVYKTLPARLVNTLGYGTATNAQLLMWV